GYRAAAEGGGSRRGRARLVDEPGHGSAVPNSLAAASAEREPGPRAGAIHPESGARAQRPLLGGGCAGVKWRRRAGRRGLSRACRLLREARDVMDRTFRAFTAGALT